MSEQLDPIALVGEALLAQEQSEPQPADREKLVQLAASSSSGLRAKWCRVLRLTPEETERAMAAPDVEPGPVRTPAERAVSREQLLAAAADQHRASGYAADEMQVIVRDLLHHWGITIPRRLRMDPLRLLNSGLCPRDLPAYRARLIPWLQRILPGRPADEPPSHRVSWAGLWVERFVERVYRSKHGPEPGKFGCSLEWLASAFEDDRGRSWPTLRAEQMLKGDFDRDEPVEFREPEALVVQGELVTEPGN